MSISTTVGGVVEEITPSATIGGVVHEFDTVHANDGGVLYEIFSKASGELPTSLTWNVDTSIANRDTYAKINSVSDDGLTISYQSKGDSYGSWDGVKNACICSNTFFMPQGSSVVVTPISITGSGSSANTMNARLFNSANEEVAKKSTYSNSSSGGMETMTLTAPSDGEYHIRLGGFGQSGSQSGIYYSSSTVTCEIAFTQE